MASKVQALAVSLSLSWPPSPHRVCLLDTVELDNPIHRWIFRNKLSVNLSFFFSNTSPSFLLIFRWMRFFNHRASYVLMIQFNFIPYNAYRKTIPLRKIQFIGGPRGFTLCRRDEYGVTRLKDRRMLKTTSLHREFKLRTDSRTLSQEYYDLREQGLGKWPAFKEQRKSFNSLFDALRRALKRYKDHRIKSGSFYIRTHPTLNAIYVMSPLYTMPRKQASRKIRRLLRNREAYAQASISKPSLGQQGSKANNEQRHNRTMKILFLYLFVMILAFMLIFL